MPTIHLTTFVAAPVEVIVFTKPPAPVEAKKFVPTANRGWPGLEPILYP